MNKLPKEKKIQLLIIAVGTVVIMAGLWFGLIAVQQEKINKIANKSLSVQQDIAKMQRVVVEASQVEVQLEAATNRLAQIEAAMPTGDLFSWTVSSLKQFNTPSYKVDMPQIGAPGVGEVKMLPNFPYNQATVVVTGTAYYYDFGKFLADLENHFPYLRVENLSLSPGSGTSPDEHEKLSFHMYIVNLVKATH
jgi:Tfp pilus assembly protein PilO